jgi:hypothetical protein
MGNFKWNMKKYMLSCKDGPRMARLGGGARAPQPHPLSPSFVVITSTTERK